MKCIRHKSIISSSLCVYKTKLINFWVYASVHQQYITFRAPDFCSCCLLDYLMAYVSFTVRGLTVPTMVASLVFDTTIQLGRSMSRQCVQTCLTQAFRMPKVGHFVLWNKELLYA